MGAWDKVVMEDLSGEAWAVLSYAAGDRALYGFALSILLDPGSL